ncbi:MAG TPA: substrate-binding domain-containing protein [Acidimicrobiales bacterium]|jgi:phosphate transport system substrate-binding protein|nr:substrate-binding domain-containing protein [Acidimicrobiales bacterium]
MRNSLRLFTAVSLAATGLLAVASLPASAAKAKKPVVKHVTCYELTSTALKHKSFAKKCPAGWSRTKPSLMGSGLPGDTDLVVPSAVSLAINGSSFDAPLIGATTSGSTAYSAGGKVTFSSYPAAGSGAGRTGITNGSLGIGFTDVPMNAAAGTLPSGTTEANYVQVPYLLGGAVVGYNLGAGFDNLKLTAAEVANIYNGTITTWSNSAIIATNGGASSTVGKALAALATNNEARNTIKVLYRNASSGTTEAFTYWLSQAGNSGIAPSGGAVMEGAGGAWKATNIDGVANNPAMAQGIVNTLGAIGYVEYSYVLIPGNDAIQVAQLQDKNGQWLEPSLANIGAAASAAGSAVTPDNFAITDEPGNNVWPFATYSWAIVPKSETNAASCEAATKYLDWETHYAQSKYATTEGYVPLPAGARAYARAQLETVTSGGTVCVTAKS